MKKILLDTNAYTRLLTGDDSVLNVVASAETVFMSIFVLGELHAGFAGGAKFRENQEILTRFLAKSSVMIVNATAETAEVFGELKNALKKAGTPTPINDVWIASHGLETGSVVITYDLHFRKIAGIRLWGEI